MENTETIYTELVELKKRTRINKNIYSHPA